MRDDNRQRLLAASRLLRPLLDDLVFVGGCVTGLLITDDAVPTVRTTIDVDTIVEITSYAEYVHFGARLGDVGLTEDTSDGAPLCRWRNGEVILDVMPLDENVLGFSNRWYREAIETAGESMLEPSLKIRRVTAPYFLSTKMAAFKSRGKCDYFGSHDLEDVLSVIDGRPELLEEVRSASRNVRDYLSQEFGKLLREPRFIDALPGHLLPDAASQSRIPMLLDKVQELAKR